MSFDEISALGHVPALPDSPQPLLLTLSLSLSDPFSALSIGLNFLDADLTGSLDAEEVPSLSAQLFQKLSKGKSRFGHEDMQSVIFTVCSKLESNYSRMHLLERENAKIAAHLVSSEQTIYQTEKNNDEVRSRREGCCVRVQASSVHAAVHPPFCVLPASSSARDCRPSLLSACVSRSCVSVSFTSSRAR
jgi:hypothetical protein